MSLSRSDSEWRRCGSRGTWHFRPPAPPSSAMARRSPGRDGTRPRASRRRRWAPATRHRAVAGIADRRCGIGRNRPGSGSRRSSATDRAASRPPPDRRRASAASHPAAPTMRSSAGAGYRPRRPAPGDRVQGRDGRSRTACWSCPCARSAPRPTAPGRAGRRPGRPRPGSRPGWRAAPRHRALPAGPRRRQRRRAVRPAARRDGRDVPPAPRHPRRPCRDGRPSLPSSGPAFPDPAALMHRTTAGICGMRQPAHTPLAAPGRHVTARIAFASAHAMRSSAPGSGAGRLTRRRSRPEGSVNRSVPEWPFVSLRE